MSLFAELQRRSVFKVAVAYLVVAWLVIQVAATVAPQMGLPDWTPRMVTLIVMLGFPVALVLAWVFDVTPEGLKVEPAATGNKRMFAIAAVLVALAIGWYWRGAVGVLPDAEGGPRSIAVLPFASIGGDAESSGLAGGLHDTLITQLSKIKGLEVRSRTSVMKYKDWSGGLKPIADELGVAVVLEGSVQRVGNRTVVNAQLIDARTDAHLWAETIDRTGDDLFALQSEIAQRVAKALAVALSPAEQQALTVAPTQDTEAYALYAEAMRLMNEADGESQDSASEAMRLKAAAVFEAAVAKDPQFALAWAMLARTYATITWNTRQLAYAEFAARTRAAAQRAIALGPELPEAKFVAGVVALQLDFDFPRAVRELSAAAEGMPSNAIAHSRLAQAKGYAGDFDGSMATLEKAASLDPNNRSIASSLRGGYVALRRFDGARALARRMAVQYPGSYGAARMLPLVEIEATGDLAPLLAFVQGADEGFRASPGYLVDRWFLEMAADDAAAALAVLDSSHEAARPDEFPLYRAETLRRLGRDEEARQLFAMGRAWLEQELATPRDPFIEALTRCRLGFVQARLSDLAGARENAIAADRLWGVEREPSDGADVWYAIAGVQVAAGDFDAAVDKLTWLAENRTMFTAGTQWAELRLAPLHSNPRFRALMQKHGVDVAREPFAENRTAAAGGAK